MLGDPLGSWRASCALARVCGAGRGLVQYADELTNGCTKMLIAGAAAMSTISASTTWYAQQLSVSPAIDARAALVWAASKCVAYRFNLESVRRYTPGLRRAAFARLHLYACMWCAYHVLMTTLFSVYVVCAQAILRLSCAGRGAARGSSLC